MFSSTCKRIESECLVFLCARRGGCKPCGKKFNHKGHKEKHNRAQLIRQTICQLIGR